MLGDVKQRRIKTPYLLVLVVLVRVLVRVLVLLLMEMLRELLGLLQSMLLRGKHCGKWRLLRQRHRRRRTHTGCHRHRRRRLRRPKVYPLTGLLVQQHRVDRLIQNRGCAAHSCRLLPMLLRRRRRLAGRCLPPGWRR